MDKMAQGYGSNREGSCVIGRFIHSTGQSRNWRKYPAVVSLSSMGVAGNSMAGFPETPTARLQQLWDIHNEKDALMLS